MKIWCHVFCRQIASLFYGSEWTTQMCFCPFPALQSAIQDGLPKKSEAAWSEAWACPTEGCKPGKTWPISWFMQCLHLTLLHFHLFSFAFSLFVSRFCLPFLWSMWTGHFPAIYGTVRLIAVVLTAHNGTLCWIFGIWNLTRYVLMFKHLDHFVRCVWQCMWGQSAPHEGYFLVMWVLLGSLKNF